VGTAATSAGACAPNLARILRTRDWLRFAVLPWAAIDGAALQAPGPTGTRLAVATACAGLALAYAYGLNTLADRGSDRSLTKNPLAGVGPLPADALLCVTLAGALALGASLWLGPLAIAATAASLAGATLYSVGPRCKALPVAGLLANTGIFVPLLGLAIRPPLPAGFALLATTFAVLLVQNQLLHELAERAEDAGAGDVTTARLLGERGTRRAVATLGVMGSGLALALAGVTPRAGIAMALCVAATVVGLRPGATARQRVQHRHFCMVGGAALFLCGLVIEATP
jgi:4-hydroxybenzoate polyprenyltransferase